MGIAYRICKYILILAAFIIAVLHGPDILPPGAKFTSFNVTPVNHDGDYMEVLHNARRLFENDIKGPESFEVVDGVMYTTLHGGYVSKVLKDIVIPVVKFGRTCDGWWDENLCGRPLGLKAYEDRYLIVADAYYGIFQYDTKTGQVIKLVDKETTINGKKPKIFNSVEITKDGTIYWTHSSSDFNLEDGVLVFLTDGSGRLIKYDRKSRTNTVLMDGLFFANGLVLSTEEDYLLVAESGHSRIHRYYLKGPKRGTSEIFIDGLPGMPDNLRRFENDFLVPLVCTRSEDFPALFQAVAPFPTLRKFFVRLISYLELALGEILKINSNYPTQRLIHYLGHLESLSPFFPPNVTVLIINGQGKIVKSYLGVDRSLASVSDVLPYNGYLYFGSPFNEYLGRLNISVLSGIMEEPVTILPPIPEKYLVPETDKSDTTTTPSPETTTTTTTNPPPTTTTAPPPETTKPPPSTTHPPSPTTTTKPSPPPTTAATPPPPSTTRSPPSPTTTTKPPPSPTTVTKPSPPPTTAATPPPPSTTRSPPTPTTTTKPPPSPTTTTKPSPPPTTTAKPPPPSTTAPPKSTEPPTTTTEPPTTTSRPPPSSTKTTAVKSDTKPTPVTAAPKNAQPPPNTREEESQKRPQP